MSRAAHRSASNTERARIAAVYAAFFTNGLIIASWVARLPAVRTRLGASEPQLGAVLLGIAGGAVVAMPLTSRLCDRFGLRRVLMMAMLGCTAMFVIAGMTPRIVPLGAVLVAVGFGYGTWDVSMNAAAHDVEVRTERPLMPRFHGAFSVGGLCGAGLGAGAAALGVPVGAHLAIVGMAITVTAALVAQQLPDLTETPSRPSDDDSARFTATQSEAPRRVITLRLVLLGLLTACTTLGEGAAADWGAIFFTDERGATESVAAIGYAAFAGAMAIGRFGGTWVLTRMSRVTALRASGVLASVSVLTLITVESMATGLVALVGWGLGVALVFPAAMSAGAENAERPAQGIATVATIGYGGFLVGPPMIGFIAGAAGLGAGLLVVSLLLLLVVVLAPAARRPAPSTAMEREMLHVGTV
ncbi:MAG TPA: MFS transporter [Desertimonas sp.]|nr:MFS transporter [Desertimonas sp.]